MDNQKRKEYTTRGADPTTVVVWSFAVDGIEYVVTEFQDVYVVTQDGKDVDDEAQVEAMRAIHLRLERDHWIDEAEAAMDTDAPPCEHEWVEQSGEPAMDACVHCGETRY